VINSIQVTLEHPGHRAEWRSWKEVEPLILFERDTARIPKDRTEQAIGERRTRP
jgi:hypothetical protein